MPSSHEATKQIASLARRTNTSVQQLQTLYALEGFLARLEASYFKDLFILKGGVLLAAYEFRRATRDIDFQATGFENNQGELKAIINQIASLDLNDGVEFDIASMKSQEIRQGSDYSGIRIRMIGLLGKARLSIGLDVSFGDPVWPGAELVTVPRILESQQQPLVVRGYPLHMVLAEKLVTAISMGDANTRWRDFADIHSIVSVTSFESAVVFGALTKVAEYRSVNLRPLLPLVSSMPSVANFKWNRWQSRTDSDTVFRLSFEEVLEAIANFSDPVISGHQGTWAPSEQKWVQGP